MGPCSWQTCLAASAWVELDQPHRARSQAALGCRVRPGDGAPVACCCRADDCFHGRRLPAQDSRWNTGSSCSAPARPWRRGDRRGHCADPCSAKRRSSRARHGHRRRHCAATAAEALRARPLRPVLTCDLLRHACPTLERSGLARSSTVRSGSISGTRSRASNGSILQIRRTTRRSNGFGSHVVTTLGSSRPGCAGFASPLARALLAKTRPSRSFLIPHSTPAPATRLKRSGS